MMNNNWDTIVNVQIYSGKSQMEKDRLAEAITEDGVKILNVSKEVIVLFTEATHGNWYAAGMHL